MQGMIRLNWKYYYILEEENGIVYGKELCLGLSICCIVSLIG